MDAIGSDDHVTFVVGAVRTCCQNTGGRLPDFANLFAAKSILRIGKLAQEDFAQVLAFEYSRWFAEAVSSQQDTVKSLVQLSLLFSHVLKHFDLA